MRSSRRHHVGQQGGGERGRYTCTLRYMIVQRVLIGSLNPLILMTFIVDLFPINDQKLLL